MRTIKIKLLGLLATMLLGATASFGQAVYYSESDGGVVIDCTMMSAGTILAASMESAEANDDHQLPSHNEANEANTVYPKLVVAIEDLYSNSGKNWDAAVTAAKSYTDGLASKTDWRLPNQRELMLIWVLKDEIVAAGAGSFDSFQSNDYWSSTVSINYADHRWYVSFEHGGTGNNSTINSRYARAVREISLP